MSTLTTSGCFNFLVVKASSKPFLISEIAHFFVVNSLKSPWFPPGFWCSSSSRAEKNVAKTL
jgi:hypothetical protein